MENKWIKVDKNIAGTMPDDALWVYNSITDEVEYSGENEHLELGIYTHYMVVKKPGKPK